MNVSLKKVNGGRVLVIDAEGQSGADKPAVYQATSVFEPASKHMVMFGVAKDLGNNLRVVYVDSKEGYFFGKIKDNSAFDFGNFPVYAFRNQPPYEGSFDALRLIIFDSSSTALNYYNVHNLVGYTLVDLEQNVPRN